MLKLTSVTTDDGHKVILNGYSAGHLVRSEYHYYAWHRGAYHREHGSLWIDGNEVEPWPRNYTHRGPYGLYQLGLNIALVSQLA